MRMVPHVFGSPGVVTFSGCSPHSLFSKHPSWKYTLFYQVFGPPKTNNRSSSYLTDHGILLW